MSDDEPNSEDPPPSNGYGFGGMPSPDVVQSRLDLLQRSYPNRDRMDLQDTLKSCGWNVTETMTKLREDMKNIQQPMSKKFATKTQKHRVKAHEAYNEAFSDSEDENDEYSDNKFVYDSDSEAEEEEIDEEHLSEDKKRVLKFFNDGTPQVKY